MKVRIIRWHGIYKPGTVIDVSPSFACRLIAKGIAVGTDVIRTETLEAPERAVLPPGRGYKGVR